MSGSTAVSSAVSTPLAAGNTNSADAAQPHPGDKNGAASADVNANNCSTHVGATHVGTGNGADVGKESIRVFIRVRPLSAHETADVVCLSVVPDAPGSTTSTQLVVKPGGPDKTFSVDGAFDGRATQLEVYEKAAKPIVESVLQGYNGAVIAYGQTSSGKTHTMRGPEPIQSEADFGIIPRMVDTVFLHIANADPRDEFQLKVSIMELYLERLKDLLDPSRSNLKIREDTRRNVFVADLTEECVTTPHEVFRLIEIGQRNRATAETLMNLQSSRSHLIFVLSVNCRLAETMTMRTGKLYLVDLAGSEKVSKTGAEGQTLDEAKMINKSLSALGNVINALTSAGGAGTGHVPYRDSKLTRVLQSTLGGNSKTSLICTVSPTLANESETISTLRFGQRAKLIENRVTANEVETVDSLRYQLDVLAKEHAELVRYAASLEQALREHSVALPRTTTAPSGASAVPAAEAPRVGDALADSLAELHALQLAMQQKEDVINRQAEEILELEIRLTETRAMVYQLETEVETDRARAAGKDNGLTLEQELFAGGEGDDRAHFAADGGKPAAAETAAEDAAALLSCLTTTADGVAEGLEEREGGGSPMSPTDAAAAGVGVALGDAAPAAPSPPASPHGAPCTPEFRGRDPGGDAAALLSLAGAPSTPGSQKRSSAELAAELEREQTKNAQLKALYQATMATRGPEFASQLELLASRLDDLVKQYRKAKAETASLRAQVAKRDEQIRMRDRAVAERERGLREYAELIAKLRETAAAAATASQATAGIAPGGAPGECSAGPGATVTSILSAYLPGARDAAPPTAAAGDLPPGGLPSPHSSEGGDGGAAAASAHGMRFWNFSSFRAARKSSTFGRLNIMRSVRGGGGASGSEKVRSPVAAGGTVTTPSESSPAGASDGSSQRAAGPPPPRPQERRRSVQSPAAYREVRRQSTPSGLNLCN